MRQSLPLLRVVLAVVSLMLITVPGAAAQDARADSIRPLDVKIGNQELSPFIELAAYHPPTSPTEERSTRPEHPLPAGQTGPRPDLDAQRQSLQQRLASEGLAAADGRDQLTAEVANVVQWTIAILVLGVSVIVGIKQFGLRGQPPATSRHLRLLETLSLGRHQGLHLIEAGSERLVVATDAGGVKSLTLLPNWPSLDESEAEDHASETHLQIFSTPAGSEAPLPGERTAV